MNKRRKFKLPLKFTLAVIVSILSVLAVLAVAVLICYKLPYLYAIAFIIQIACIIKIIASDDNPDYKVPWLVVIMSLPIVGFMLYFMFYSHKLSGRFVKKLKNILKNTFDKNDDLEFDKVKKVDLTAHNQFLMLKKVSGCNLYNDTEVKYYKSIEVLMSQMLNDLKNAKRFIYLEFFIIKEGVFWNSISDILKEKASCGLDVKMLYDDIGCKSGLPSNTLKELKKFGVKVLPFSKMKWYLNSEVNNRNHRKIMVIDGSIAYTGGFNLADEYINAVNRFGHWKDVGVRLYGNGVWEFTKLFLVDFSVNSKAELNILPDTFPFVKPIKKHGYIMPFGDGPKPLYQRQVSKSLIQNMVACAKEYIYITTPYLIIDNDLLSDIENASMRGVDVRIILPEIPDKKLVFTMSRSYYSRLINAGVKIYQYTPGFIHAKTYLVDGKYALIGTVNLDYRSLVHHFENGVFMFETECISDIKADLNEVIQKSRLISKEEIKDNFGERLICSLVKIFAPLM